MANSSVKSKCGSFLNRKTLSDSPTTTHSSNTALYSPSLSFKSVCLHDWWIIKPPEGQQGLAVAGFSSREGKNDRAFKSAPISKRHDATTLETVDGFTIALVGSIDKYFTEQNGFSDEICCNFYFGFPYNWEEYMVKGSTEVLHAHASDFAKPAVRTRSRSQRNDSQPESLDDPPVTSRSDPLMSSRRESDCCIRTMKAMDDLFECLSQLENDESPSFPENNNAKSSEAVKMASNSTQEGCTLAKDFSTDTDIQGNSCQSESYNDPPEPEKPCHINRNQESGHTMPAKRKIGDKKIAEGSFLVERFNSDSATAKMTVSAEIPTTLTVDGTSGTVGNKHTVGHTNPLKRKTSDKKIAEGSFPLENSNGNSATAKMTVSAETPTTLTVDGTSGIVGNKHTVGHTNPIKRKTSDKKIAEGSFPLENSNGNSATEKMTVSAETPTTLTVDGTSGTVGNKHTVGHTKQTKRKRSDKKITEGSLPSENISSDSATAKVTVSAETPTTLTVDGTSGIVGNKHTVGHTNPIKRKTSDKNIAEGSFPLENISGDSATAKMTVSAEIPTTLTVDGTSGTVGYKHTVGHTKQTKRKRSDKKITEGSLPSENISSDSATAKVTVSAETPAILVDNISRTIGKKHTASRKITRSMTKRKLR
ncbi:hypothetical protein QQ045_007047 [Rhodiola kirilowii]